jgi:hypothetical protein
MLRSKLPHPALLFYKGYEINQEVLEAVVNNDRVLWAFIKKDGMIMPVPYGEEQVIWIQPADLERNDGEVSE